MAWIQQTRLISLFGLYLMLMFFVASYMRFSQYRTVLRLVTAVPGRWPRLFKLVRQYASIFLTWGTIAPMALSLGLIVANAIANNFIWPAADATLTLGELVQLWPALPVVAGLCGWMLFLDLTGTFRVTRLDQQELEKHLDLAEYWLRSWTAPAVRVFTFGFVNPRKIVGVEVRKALIDVSRMLNNTLWWVSLQTGVRLLYGLSLYMTYLLSPWLRSIS
jgi:hypothetical protein